MCLMIRDKSKFEPQVAKENIVCYKLMRKGLKSFLLFGQRSYFSPIYTKKWKLNELHTSRLFSSMEDDLSWGIEPETVIITDGLHSCQTLEGARNFLSVTTSPSKYTICRGIIPEGALYYEAGALGGPEFTSNKLILTDAGLENG